MPTTVAGFLALVVAVLPGLPGDKVYRLLIGSDWREEQWQKLVHLLAFSVFGLTLYVTIGSVFGFPAPTYLSPSHLATAFQQPDALAPMFFALMGHFAGSGLTGLLSAFGARGLVRWTSVTLYTNAWDHFVFELVPRHWVVVRLDNGDTYSGMLELADTSVQEDERDLILEEPGEYDEGSGEYLALGYQYLFMPGRLISSVAVVHDPEDDQRLTEIGSTIFKEDA